jgi:hypothetical protein
VRNARFYSQNPVCRPDALQADNGDMLFDCPVLRQHELLRIARSTQWPYLPEASDKPTSGTVSSTRTAPSTAILVATFYFHLFLLKHEIGMSTRLGIAFDGPIMT